MSPLKKIRVLFALLFFFPFLTDCSEWFTLVNLSGHKIFLLFTDKENPFPNDNIEPLRACSFTAGEIGTTRYDFDVNFKSIIIKTENNLIESCTVSPFQITKKGVAITFDEPANKLVLEIIDNE